MRSTLVTFCAHRRQTPAHARGPKRVLRVDVSHRALHVAVRLERAPAVHVLTAVNVRALAALALAGAVAVAHRERRGRGVVRRPEPPTLAFDGLDRLMPVGEKEETEKTKNRIVSGVGRGAP